MAEELVDRRIVLSWVKAGLIWGFITPLIGFLLSMDFNFPDWLQGISWLSFGRLRPFHTNGVVLGAFTTMAFASIYYMVPKLTGVPMRGMKWARPMFHVFNIALTAGLIAVCFGYNKGLEVADLPVWSAVPLWLCFLVLTGQVLSTIAVRKEPQMYVSLWYLTAALVWTDLNLPFGNVILVYWIPGVMNAAMHGLYLHYVVGLWITPMGLAMIYFFLPLAAENPVYSHKLSMLGFWTIAFFYPFVGTHHYLFSPIADWVETISIVTSMALIIPVWTVCTNFFGTMQGNWVKFQTSYAAKFMILGAFYYLVGSTQGSLEALRRVQELTHFSDLVIAHSHLTVFGTFILWGTAAGYYIVPRVTGKPLWSNKLADWNFWTIVVSFSAMAIDLTYMGLMQGYMLESGADFVDTIVALKPWWFVRTVAGLTMDISMLFFAINMWKTIGSAAPASTTTPATAPTPALA